MSGNCINIKTGPTRLITALAVLMLSLLGATSVFAAQITLSYIDANSQAQTLAIDSKSSHEVLGLAASLMGENGVWIVYDENQGIGTLPELAAALASAAQFYAPDVALALVTLSPDDKDAIVEAVNAVPEVDTESVLVAVKYGVLFEWYQWNLNPLLGIERSASGS
jgi:hypothetical protein